MPRAPSRTRRTPRSSAGTRALGDRFGLITQNVDGLHRRAGSPAERTYPIHGDIGLMRCAVRLHRSIVVRSPMRVPALGKGEPVTAEARGTARVPALWRDGAAPRAVVRRELRRAAVLPRHRAPARRPRATLLIVAGTSAQTNLPWQVVTLAARAGATIVDINVEDNPFGDIAAESGGALRGPAAVILPALVDALTHLIARDWTPAIRTGRVRRDVPA